MENKLLVDFDDIAEYLKDNIHRFLYCVNGCAGFPTAQFIEDMRKHFLEEKKREFVSKQMDVCFGNHDDIDKVMQIVNYYLSIFSLDFKKENNK